MAYNKEYVIFVLDVRQNTPEEFKQKSIKCCAEVMKRKICCGKKDFVSFVLVGTEQTQNSLNRNESFDKYLNIVEYPCEMEIPSWELLMNFYQFVNESAANNGEWLDAMAVALGMLKSGVICKKVARLRMVLFYDFNHGLNSYDYFDNITKSLLEYNVDLIIIAPDIAYVDNESNNFLPQGIFNTTKTSQKQLENQKYALRIVSDGNANLCNLKEAEFFINKSDNKRPWTWNSELRIGTEIKIKVAGIIAAKNECSIKLKKVWKEKDEELTREWGYYINGNRITPSEGDLIEGYMLGGTSIPFDESVCDDEDKIKLPTGLTFMGFVPRESVHEEYFSGDSVYIILHQRGSQRSAKIIDALVRVLLKANRAMVCWKTYSEKFSNPKIVVLIPNEIVEDSPSSFYMYEMAYHDQYQFFEFPKLTSKNTECSEEQLNAIDNLIDAMDLTIGDDDFRNPRATRHKDILPFDNLPHIFEKNFIDLMERKILCKASEEDEFFEEILKDKNFAEIFWRIPEQIEEKAKVAAKEVKRLFPLKANNDWLEKVKAEENSKVAKLTQTFEDNESSTSTSQLWFDHVRSSTPAEDFEQLLKFHVFPIKSSTQRDVKFNHYASQIRAVIKDLIFKSKTSDLNVDKIISALMSYRKHCFVFNAFDDYNTWIVSIKTEVVNRRMIKFWQDVIVSKELGLCFIGEPSLDEQIKEREFYSLGCQNDSSEDSLNDIDVAVMEMDDTYIDNLLSNLP